MNGAPTVGSTPDGSFPVVGGGCAAAMVPAWQGWRSFWSLGGGLLASDVYYGRHAVSRVATCAADWSEAVPSRFWLEQWIGYDWSGKAIWRVLDATPVTQNPITHTCHLVDGQGRAFAEIDSWEDPPLRAWTVDADYTHFEEISTDNVWCEEEVGD